VVGDTIVANTADGGYASVGTTGDAILGQAACASQPIPGTTNYFIMVNMWR
jgi:hypothetical protein